MRRLPARRSAVFLDRDGVINREVDYLSDPKDLEILRGAPEAIRELREAGFKVIVISNQSGVARGYFTVKTLGAITRKLNSELAKSGAKLDAVYYCVHHPDAGRRVKCECRKPGILMVERAARRFRIDLSRSYVVGDTTTDLQTARNAGCGALLVRTGKGGRDRQHPAKADKTFKDLRAAAHWIMRTRLREAGHGD